MPDRLTTSSHATPSPPALRLSLSQCAYLRAIAQGLTVVDASRRFLSIEHAAAAAGAHRRVVEHVAAIARRRGDPRWRLLGLVIEPRAIDSTPSLAQWAESEGLGAWSEAELQVLYAERFGPSDPRQHRRQLRDARLVEKRLALLRELEAVAAEPATQSDSVAGWLAPGIAASLATVDVTTLGDLQRQLALGGRWWRALPGWGPVKAGRVAEQLATLLGPPRARAWPAPISAAEPGTLSGRNGANRAGEPPRIDAQHDRAAIAAWITARAGSSATALVYEREAERFLLWCVLERGRALSDATADDCRAYMDFVQDVPDRWISKRRVARLAPEWAPFRGPLSIASQGVMLAALHSLFAWLVQARYLQSNPWVLVNRHLGDDPNTNPEDVTSRAFTPAAWAALRAEIVSKAPDASSVRLDWLCTFAEATGLRASELLSRTRKHVVRRGEGWWVQVHGKGRKNRLVPVPSAAMKATRSYFMSRGLRFDDAPEGAPLLASLTDPSAPISYSALAETFGRFVRRAAKRLPAAERAHAENASAHWLRHTHATRAAEREVPLDVLQANLGQNDPRTTARYYQAQLERRQAEMERVYGS